jgi:hypothetical protein
LHGIARAQAPTEMMPDKALVSAGTPEWRPARIATSCEPDGSPPAESVWAGAEIMYAIIRRHPGGEHTVTGGLAEEARRVILPRLQSRPGFAGYLAFVDEAGLPVSVGLFSDRQMASAAFEGDLAVAESSGVDVTAGAVELAQAGHEHGGTATADTPLYVTIRFYAGVAPAEEVIPLIRGLTVPLMQRQPGFRGIFALRDERHPGHVASVSFWDSRRAAMAAHELVRDVVLRQMADIFPEAPEVVAGATYVASLDKARLCTA